MDRIFTRFTGNIYSKNTNIEILALSTFLVFNNGWMSSLKIEVFFMGADNQLKNIKMFTIRTLARKVSMNKHTRKMSYGKIPYKDKIEEVVLKVLIVGTPFVVTIGSVVGITGATIFILDSMSHSDMVQNHRDNSATQEELRRLNKKREVFFQGEDGVWRVKKE